MSTEQPRVTVALSTIFPSRTVQSCILQLWPHFLLILHLISFSLFCIDAAFAVKSVSLFPADRRFTVPGELLVYFFFTTVFLVWLLCLSFHGRKHWEYYVKSNGDGRLAELVNLVVEDYPRVPLVLYFPVLPGEEQNGHFLKPKHWFFRCDVKHRSESEYPRQIPLWLIAFVYSGLLIWNTMHCWNHPHSHMINSLSGKAGLSEFYVHFQHFLVAVVLCTVIVCLLTAYSTDMFYKDVARRVKAFVMERRQMSSSDADAFLKAIGKQGLAYFVFVANATSDPHFLFLLFLVVCDFCVVRRIRIPFDDSLTNFEEEKFDTSMDLELTPEAPSRPINLLLNRSYSHRRKSMVDRSSRGQDLMRLMQLA
uniref:DUF1084 domain-containing protein n=1 Tax=Panagrellus redivivus TaxID=6233 RepID=A0A7E4VME7_PANRE